MKYVREPYKKIQFHNQGNSGETKITEENSAEILAEIRYALLEADVALPVVKNFIANIKRDPSGRK